MTPERTTWSSKRAPGSEAPLMMHEEGLPVSWLLFVGGGLCGFHASICAEEIWLTFADRCGTLQCLLRIVGFG